MKTMAGAANLITATRIFCSIALLFCQPFSPSFMKGWMERENEMIACCSDGTRPVIFRIERINYEEE